MYLGDVTLGYKPKLGDTFIYKGVRFRVVPDETKTCKGCFFQGSGSCPPHLKCSINYVYKPVLK